jgi:hypothetical protein
MARLIAAFKRGGQRRAWLVLQQGMQVVHDTAFLFIYLQMPTFCARKLSLTRILQRRRLRSVRKALGAWRSYVNPLVAGWGRSLVKARLRWLSLCFVVFLR